MTIARLFALAAALLASAPASAQAPVDVQIGPRPFFLVDDMRDGALKEALRQCAGPFRRSEFSIAHRGAPLMFPEHTRESYMAAARMGAGVIECDVTFTRDRELVCRHSQCDLHTTTDILLHGDIAAQCTQGFVPADPEAGTQASAKCCTSDITLSQFRRLKGKMDGANFDATTVEDFVAGTPAWRTDLHASRGTLMTHAESIALFDRLGVKMTPELKAPEVAMPFEGEFTREDYAAKLIGEYEAAGIEPSRVLAQSFSLADVEYWLARHPEFGRQAVFLDGRSARDGFDVARPESWSPSMEELAARGAAIIAPPLWMLLAEGPQGRPVASAYAKAARAAGLKIIAWTVERSGSLVGGGGWYYQTVGGQIDRDGDVLEVLDVLAREVGVIGVFSDWPATTSFYASCTGRD